DEGLEDLPRDAERLVVAGQRRVQGGRGCGRSEGEFKVLLERGRGGGAGREVLGRGGLRAASQAGRGDRSQSQDRPAGGARGAASAPAARQVPSGVVAGTVGGLHALIAPCLGASAGSWGSAPVVGRADRWFTVSAGPITSCERGDLNPHVRRHWNLNPARLPIPPRSLAPAAHGRPQPV